MKYFFDRNLSVHLARMASQYKTAIEVRHLDDDSRFRIDSSDVEIIQALQNESPSPVFVTGDLNIKRKHPHERKALGESGLTAIFFRKTFHNMQFEDQVVKFFKVWPRILEEIAICEAPTIFEVTPNAKLIRIGHTVDL